MYLVEPQVGLHGNLEALSPFPIPGGCGRTAEALRELPGRASLKSAGGQTRFYVATRLLRA